MSICSNVFPTHLKALFSENEPKLLACHEVFAHSDCVLIDDGKKSTVLESEGIKVAFIVAKADQSSVPGERTEDRSAYLCRAVQEICAAKAQNDFVIVSYPCSVTTGIYPPARIRQVCRTMVRNGADVVLCRMSCGISSYELFRNATILYGYGEQKTVEKGEKKGRLCQEMGMIVHLDISDRIEFQFIPVRITETQIEPLDGKERQKSLERLVENSERMKG